MFPTKVENKHRKCNGLAPLFSRLLQIQISPKQNCNPTAIRLESKLCSLLIGIVALFSALSLHKPSKCTLYQSNPTDYRAPVRIKSVFLQEWQHCKIQGALFQYFANLSSIYPLCSSVKENTPAVKRQQGYSSWLNIVCCLLHKPSVLGIALDGFADTRDKLGSVQRTVEERIYVTRFVGSRKEVVNPPQINLWIVPSGKVLVHVIRLCYGVDMAVRKLHSRQCLSLGCGQVLVQPRLADKLGELVLGKVAFLHRGHPLYMTFGIVFSEQAQVGIEQVLHPHYPQFTFESIG